MGESDLTEYERKITEINKVLQDYKLKPIDRKDYNNLKLKKILGLVKNADSEAVAANALRVIGREKESLKLTKYDR